MNIEHERELLNLPPVEELPSGLRSVEPDYQFRFLRITWQGIVIPSYNISTYLNKPEELLEHIREAAVEHTTLRNDPDHKIFGFIPARPFRFRAIKGRWIPTTLAPWECEERDDTYLTVVSERFRDNEAIGCTHYIKLSEHQRIVDQTEKEALESLGDIVSHHVERGVETGIARAIETETATRKQVEVERQRIEVQKAALERQLAKLDQAEKRLEEREKAKQARRSQPAITKGYVYLLRTDTGHWKIGRTNNPENRLKTFNVKLPFLVAYEHLIPCQDMYAAETELHEKYAAKRINGSEFFALNAEEVAEIKSIERL